MEDKFTNRNIAPAETDCDFKKGMLPMCAPLANAYIPMQQENPPKYSNEDALTRGTLFPGLDLPFMNITNKSNPYAGTPLGELMALSFVIKELNLYLDTHRDDMEAFDMLKNIIELSTVGHERYVKMYGPLLLNDLTYFDSYTWLNDPWPWEFTEGMAKK